jgi:hypothetical protein
VLFARFPRCSRLCLPERAVHAGCCARRRCISVFYGTFAHDFGAMALACRGLESDGSVATSHEEVTVEMQTRARPMVENAIESAAHDGAAADDDAEDAGLLSRQ